MAEPISTTVKIALSAASAATSVVGRIQQGRALQSAASQERQQAEDAATLARTQASQEEAERLRKRRRDLGTQIAIAGGLGFDPTQSRSFFAITRETTQTAAKDISNIRLKGFTRARSFELQAAQSTIEGKAARTSSMIKASGALLGGAKDIGKILKNT